MPILKKIKQGKSQKSILRRSQHFLLQLLSSSTVSHTNTHTRTYTHKKTTKKPYTIHEHVRMTVSRHYSQNHLSELITSWFQRTKTKEAVYIFLNYNSSWKHWWNLLKSRKGYLLNCTSLPD